MCEMKSLGKRLHPCRYYGHLNAEQTPEKRDSTVTFCTKRRGGQVQQVGVPVKEPDVLGEVRVFLAGRLEDPGQLLQGQLAVVVGVRVVEQLRRFVQRLRLQSKCRVCSASGLATSLAALE